MPPICLLLTGRAPLRVDRGDRLRAFSIARIFSESGYDVEVCAFEENGRLPSPGALEKIASRVDVVHRSKIEASMAALPAVFSRTPLQVAYYRSKTMRALVAGAAMRRPSVIIAHLFRMAPLVPEVHGAYRILDLCDAVGGELVRSLPHRSGFSRLVYRIETPRVRRYEVKIADQFDEIWVVSPRDREELLERGAPVSIRVIPNGVDPSWLANPRSAPPARRNRILFVGHLAVPHNVDAVRFFASKVMPLIRLEDSHAEFMAVGEGAGGALRRLEKRGLVTLPGFTPDLRRTLEEATVVVAPLRFSAGVQNKVIEAMAAGRPVIATPEVNAGIGAQPGQEIVLAAEAGSLAAETLALLRDPERCARLGAAGRALVASRFTWNALRARAEALRRRRPLPKSP